jgi:predicted MFS family arabinose efflux permease
MLPLVGELALPHRRATALSIVSSGLMLGMLIARVLSGIIATYSSWRNVYWMALALQSLISILLWLFMPDYPQKNTDIRYFHVLWSIVDLVIKSPLIAQTCLMVFFMTSTFTGFWTTLTFLLSNPPYSYSSLVIGLFALAGIIPISMGPVVARFFIDHFHPFVSVAGGEFITLGSILIGTYTGTFTVAGPILQAIFLDFGQQITAIANRTAIYTVAPKASNRINTAYMLAAFCGQIMGTSVGNSLFAQGGWIHSGSASAAFTCAAILLCFLRGPHEKRWIGWHGGFNIRRPRETNRDEDQQSQNPLPVEATSTDKIEIEKQLHHQSSS